ncbi:MAG: hypothetical protein IKT27_00390 [Clostridia bacterium]|nr:hypothetical protein [Clostridia bacterium]
MLFEKNVLNFTNKSKISEEQILLDSSFTAENGYNKILWADVSVQIDNAEPMTKELSYSGKAIFEVQYLDTENKAKKYVNTVPFLNKFIHESISPSVKVSLVPKVSNIEVDSISEKINAVVNLEATIYNIGEIEVITGGDDNLCIQTSEEFTESLLKEDCTIFNEEITVDITEKMSNVLGVKSCVIVKDVIPNKDFFTVEGEVQTVVKYINSGDEIDRVETMNFSENFRREIEVVGLTNEGKVDVCAHIKYDAYKYDVNRETNKIDIVAPINICFKAFDKMQVNVANDLFSITHALSVVTNSYSKTEMQTPEYFEAKVEGSISIEDTQPRIDKIIGFSNANLNVTNFYVQDGVFVVEGIVSFDIAYLNDEMGNVITTHIEIPFSINTKLQIDNDAVLFPQIDLADVEVTARRGREIYLDAKLKSLVNYAKKVNGAVITNAEQGEMYDEKKYAIEIYFGKKGDDLWDIARELRIKPETISIQNPNLILPLEQNENVVVYNQRNG